MSASWRNASKLCCGRDPRRAGIARAHALCAVTPLRPRPPVTPFDIVILITIGFTAGVSNAVVGGGTLFTFPVILSVGFAPVIANATTTVALWPGTMTAARAQVQELKRTRTSLTPRVIGATLGGVIGALLLLASGDELFFKLVPWLLAVATALFTFSRPIVRRIAKVSGSNRSNQPALITMEFVASIYGGYFGAAIGILLLASMALAGEHDMQRANAQRNFLVCFINGIATLLFNITGHVDWLVAPILMVGSIVGGYVGARLTKHIPNAWLRRLITLAGAAFAVFDFVKVYK